MYFYDVFINGEYHLTLKANCDRDAYSTADERYGCYGTLDVRKVDETQTYVNEVVYGQTMH